MRGGRGRRESEKEVQEEGGRGGRERREGEEGGMEGCTEERREGRRERYCYGNRCSCSGNLHSHLSSAHTRAHMGNPSNGKA